MYSYRAVEYDSINLEFIFFSAIFNARSGHCFTNFFAVYPDKIGGEKSAAS